MSKAKYQGLDGALLIQEYIAAAKQHALASEQGDHRRANKQFDVLNAIYAELKPRGSVQQELLLNLLDDESEAVRVWAAFHALDFSPADGERVLEDLSKGSGLEGLSAQLTLREWRKGALSFP